MHDPIVQFILVIGAFLFFVWLTLKFLQWWG